MYQKILVAIDDSETSRSALAEAAHIARTSNAKLYIAHVADETLLNMHRRTLTTTLDVDKAIASISAAGRQLLDAAQATVGGVETETVLLEAMNRRVSEVIVDKAKELDIDLIVIGRHGQRGLARFILGSVAEQIAKMADVSVLLVRKH